MTENNLLPPPVIETPEVREILKPIKPKFKFSPIFFIIVLSLFFVSTILAAYYYGISQKKPIAVLPTPTLNEPTSVPTTLPTIVENDGDFGKITWYSSPIKTANPDVLQKVSNPNEISYAFDATRGTYEIASFFSGAKLLVSFMNGEGPGASYIFRIIKQDNQYFLNESLILDKYIKPELSKIFDKTRIKFISYDTLGLLPPDYINVNNKVFKSGLFFMSSQAFSELKNPVKTISSQYGDFYTVYTDAYNNSEIVGREFYLKLPDYTVITYRPELTFFYDDKVPNVTINNTVNKEGYMPGIPFKCGLGAAYTVIKNGSSILNDKQEIGFVTNSANEKIYQIKNTQSELIKVLYFNYKTGRDYPSAPPYLPIDQFANTNNHFLYQDSFGEWILFVNSQYAPMVECGKPVIYLYPQKDTEVSVKVGAEITKSEPLYPENGWTVLAHPSGQLDYQGQSYPNLFWEGTGKGFYPNLTNYGFVVAQKDLISTLNSQLKQLGLNTKESADFMEFWTDKLPATPYVRLSWLGTAQMNQLAPYQSPQGPIPPLESF